MFFRLDTSKAFDRVLRSGFQEQELVGTGKSSSPAPGDYILVAINI